jgi:hypothetical protein
MILLFDTRLTVVWLTVTVVEALVLHQFATLCQFTMCIVFSFKLPVDGIEVYFTSQ